MTLDFFVNFPYTSLTYNYIIQMLVWIIGSTYRKGQFLKQSWNNNTEQQASILPLPEIHIGL